jgi:hypothetical protein
MGGLTEEAASSCPDRLGHLGKPSPEVREFEYRKAFPTTSWYSNRLRCEPDSTSVRVRVWAQQRRRGASCADARAPAQRGRRVPIASPNINTPTATAGAGDGRVRRRAVAWCCVSVFTDRTSCVLSWVRFCLCTMTPAPR